MNLKQVIEQIEYDLMQIDNFKQNIADSKKELKSKGYDITTINQLLKYRKDPSKWEEQEQLLECMINEVK